MSFPPYIRFRACRSRELFSGIPVVSKYERICHQNGYPAWLSSFWFRWSKITVKTIKMILLFYSLLWQEINVIFLVAISQIYFRKSPYLPYNDILPVYLIFSLVKNDKQFMNVSYAVIINMTLIISIFTLCSYHQGSVQVV